MVALFNNKLKYRYLGNWEDRPNNSNIEEGIVRKYLSQKGYNEILISCVGWIKRSESTNLIV